MSEPLTDERLPVETALANALYENKVCVLAYSSCEKIAKNIISHLKEYDYSISAVVTDERLREAVNHIENNCGDCASPIEGGSGAYAVLQGAYFDECWSVIKAALAELAELRARCERQSALLARCSVLLDEKAMNMTPPAKETDDGTR